MRPAESCFIIFCICLNWLSSALISCTVVPPPLAMREALLEADPASPLVAPATRRLMSAHQGEGRQTTVDNAVALRALADELRGSGELGRRYTYTAVLGDTLWGRATVSPTTLAPPRVLTAPLGSRLSTARAHSTQVRVSRSDRTGRLYYALRLAYYPRVDRVGPLARGVTIARQYLYRGRPVTAALLGVVLRVRLTVRSAQNLYYVRVEDPLPAGAEAADPTLLTLPPRFAFSPGYVPWAGYGHGTSGATPAALTTGSAARRCAISPPRRRARMSSSSAHRSLKAASISSRGRGAERFSKASKLRPAASCWIRARSGWRCAVCRLHAKCTQGGGYDRAAQIAEVNVVQDSDGTRERTHGRGCPHLPSHALVRPGQQPL
jgi:hypothetical protein